MTDRELMQQALEAFEWNYNTDLDNIPACEQWAKMLKENIAALRAALAEPEQPVAWWDGNSKFAIPKAKDWDKRTGGTTAFGCDIPLYTAPTPRNDINAELVEALRWIGDHDLSGCDLVAAGYMAHGFIGKARAALAKVESK